MCASRRWGRKPAFTCRGCRCDSGFPARRIGGDVPATDNPRLAVRVEHKGRFRSVSSAAVPPFAAGGVPAGWRLPRPSLITGESAVDVFPDSEQLAPWRGSGELESARYTRGVAQSLTSTACITVASGGCAKVPSPSTSIPLEAPLSRSIEAVERFPCEDRALRAVEARW